MGWLEGWANFYKMGEVYKKERAIREVMDELSKTNSLVFLVAELLKDELEVESGRFEEVRKHYGRLIEDEKLLLRDFFHIAERESYYTSKKAFAQLLGEK